MGHTKYHSSNVYRNYQYNLSLCYHFNNMESNLDQLKDQEHFDRTFDTRSNWRLNIKLLAYLHEIN